MCPVCFVNALLIAARHQPAAWPRLRSPKFTDETKPRKQTKMKLKEIEAKKNDKQMNPEIVSLAEWLVAPKGGDEDHLDFTIDWVRRHDQY
jgi:hypothetical protein